MALVTDRGVLDLHLFVVLRAQAYADPTFQKWAGATSVWGECTDLKDYTDQREGSCARKDRERDTSGVILHKRTCR